LPTGQFLNARSWSTQQQKRILLPGGYSTFAIPPDPKIDHDKRTITPVYFNKANLHSETIHATSIVNPDNFAMVFALPSGQFYFDKKTSRRISGLSHPDNFIQTGKLLSTYRD